MDCSHRKVRILLEELIDLRKKAPQEISDVYARRYKNILKYLNNVKIVLRQNYDFKEYDIKPTNPFENLNMKQLDELVEKIYQQIQLLRILIKKKSCPISEIIDDI